MPTQKLTFKPGINLELSATLNMGGFSDSNLVRTRMGLIEKLGGWQRMSDQTMLGSVRNMHAWADLDRDIYLAIGSELALQVFTGTALNNITPLRRTASTLTNFVSTTVGSSLVTITDTVSGAQAGDMINIPMYISPGGGAGLLFGTYRIVNAIDANNYQIDSGTAATGTVAGNGRVPQFITTNASNVVTVNLPNHGFNANDIFVVQYSTSVAGLTLNGSYLVATVVDTNNFTITAAGAAGSSTSAFENGGNAVIQYYIASGIASNIQLAGWGIGGWGIGPWGGGVGGSGAAGIRYLRDWSLDNFGQVLMAVPRDGSLYQWTPDPHPPPISASLVTQAPSVNRGMFVAMPQEQVVLYGASVAGNQDPLLIAWCDAGDYTIWTASITNEAGTFRLSEGSMIQGALQAPQMAMIWTDIELWSMHYIQPPFVYSFEKIGMGCGLIGKNAACVLNEQVYWVSQRDFFVLDGQGLRPLPCTVWDFIFKNLTTTQRPKIHLAPNSNFSELACFFPAADGAGEVDSYVKYNLLDQTWDKGNLVRLAWIDQSVFGPPIGVDGPGGLLQQHETAVDADGSPMTGVSVLTGYADLQSGEDFIFIHQLIPDFRWTGSTNGAAKQVTVTIYLIDYPGDAEPEGAGIGVVGPLRVTSATQYITIQKRARQVAMLIESDTTGVQWRLGAFRYKGQADGRL